MEVRASTLFPPHPTSHPLFSGRSPWLQFSPTLCACMWFCLCVCTHVWVWLCACPHIRMCPCAYLCAGLTPWGEAVLGLLFLKIHLCVSGDPVAQGHTDPRLCPPSPGQIPVLLLCVSYCDGGANMCARVLCGRCMSQSGRARSCPTPSMAALAAPSPCVCSWD
jgi:hypothetical protein